MTKQAGITERNKTIFYCTGREEAQERKKLERHNEDKEMTDEKKLVQNTLTVQMDVQLLNFK